MYSSVRYCKLGSLVVTEAKMIDTVFMVATVVLIVVAVVVEI